MEPKLLVDFYGVWRGVDRHFVCLAGCPRGKEERTPDTLPLKARFHEEERDVAAAARRQHADQLVFNIGPVLWQLLEQFFMPASGLNLTLV